MQIFNEPEGCHGMAPMDYVRSYDAIVQEVRKQADPNKKIKVKQAKKKYDMQTRMFCMCMHVYVCLFVLSCLGKILSSRVCVFFFFFFKKKKLSKNVDALFIRSLSLPSLSPKFVGLALEKRGLDWMSAFLNNSNHQPDVFPDIASFHFYSIGTSRMDTDAYEMLFYAADGFFKRLREIVALREELSPSTQLSCNEMGVILPNDNDQDAPTPPARFWCGMC